MGDRSRAFSVTKQERVIRVIDNDVLCDPTFFNALSSLGHRVLFYRDARQFFTQDIPSIPGCVLASLEADCAGFVGTDVLKESLTRGITLPFIFFTAEGCVDRVVKAMQCGAVGVVDLFAQEAIPQCFEAIERALALEGSQPLNASDALCQWRQLTEREQEISYLLRLGLKNKEIAYRLGGLSPKTIQAHIGDVLRKLNVETREDIATWMGVVLTVIDPKHTHQPIL